MMEMTEVKRKEKGSITLFLALVLTLIVSLCFSFLEAARVHALEEIAARSLWLELESALGEYHPGLWEEYGLLFLNGGNDSGQLDLAMLEGRRIEDAALGQKGTGFYQTALRSLEITGYTLATDDAGAAFLKQACAAIQAQLSAGAAELVKDRLQNGKELAGKSGELKGQWESAKDAMNKADEIEKDKENDDKKQDVPVDLGKKPPGSLPENPVKSVDLLKKSAMLSMVVENPSEISQKAITVSDTLKKRTRAQGNLKPPDGGILDQAWFLQYLDHYFSCETGVGEGGSREHALEYELEYCIAGKGSDPENLEAVVKQLLLIREAGNFMTIMQDGKKQALAMEIAAAAVGFTGIVPLVQAVQMGILLAWSYVESVLDVRCLLSGGKVALIKPVTDWKSDVSLGKEALAGKTDKTQSRENGLDYRAYLQILLLTVGNDTLSYRAMDIIERNMSLKDPAFCMDCQIHGMQAEGLYTAKPLFSGFVMVGRDADGTYHFRENCKMAYLE